MRPSKLITDELFAMLNECYKLSTNKCLKCDLVQKNFNKKSAVISNRTLKRSIISKLFFFEIF